MEEKTIKEVSAFTGINKNNTEELLIKIYDKVKELKKEYYYRPITSEIEENIKEETLTYIEGLSIEYSLSKKQYNNLRDYCKDNLSFK